MNSTAPAAANLAIYNAVVWLIAHLIVLSSSRLALGVYQSVTCRNPSVD
jgi:hypothetical protein